MNNTCTKCGMPIPDNQKLCEPCRNRGLALNKMYEFYNDIKVIDAYRNNICNLKNQLAVVSKKNWESSLLILALILMLGFALPFFMLFFTAIYSLVTGVEVTNNILGVGAIIWCAIAVIVIIATIVITKPSRKKFYDDRDAEIARIKNLIAAEQNKLDSTYENTNRYIPKAYMEPKIVQILIQLIETKRADSLKEAINLFENIKDTQIMIQLQSEINKNAANAANAAAISAVANVVTAYNTRR